MKSRGVAAFDDVREERTDEGRMQRRWCQFQIGDLEWSDKVAGVGECLFIQTTKALEENIAGCRSHKNNNLFQI